MSRVLDYNPDDLTASVEAGLTADGRRWLAARRQLLPVDPPGVGCARSADSWRRAAAGPSGRAAERCAICSSARFVQPDGP